MLFFSPIAGYISDNFGYKNTIVFATITGALLLFSFTLVKNYMELLIVRIVQALFGVLLGASFLHLASAYAKRNGIYIGYLRIAQAFGMAAGPLLVFIISTFSHKEFMLLSAFLCLAPFSALLLEEPKTNKTNIDGMRVIKYIIRRELIPLYLCTISEVLSVSVLFSYIVVGSIKKFNISQRMYAFILFVTISTFGIASVLASKLSDRYPHQSAIFGSLMMAIFTYLIFISNDIFLFVTFFIAFEAISAFAFNPLYVVASKIISDEMKGMGINLVDAIVNTTFITLPFLEILAENYGLYFTLVPTIFISLLSSIYALINLVLLKRSCTDNVNPNGFSYL